MKHNPWSLNEGLNLEQIVGIFPERSAHNGISESFPVSKNSRVASAFVISFIDLNLIAYL